MSHCRFSWKISIAALLLWAGPVHLALPAASEELQILRDNMPFGTLGKHEFGTYYIAYSSSPSVTEEMLEHMFIGNPTGNYDRILDFSTPITGTLFFVPTADFLENPPPLPGREAGVSTDAPVQAGEDESLGIGGLRGDT